MNKKKLEVKSEPLRYDKGEGPPEVENKIKENVKSFFDSAAKAMDPYGLPKKGKTMKKTKGDSIDIKHEVYNKLESYRAEGSADNLSDVINNFILYYEADQEPEDDRYYCDNCGDYHD